MRRKILVLLSALIIMMTLPIIAKAATIDSGECGANGDNLTWTLDDKGILIISGDGNMKDYNYEFTDEDDMYFTSPFFPYRSDIVTVIMKNNVTNIGKLAFADCYNLTSVIIPEGVNSIGEGAFAYCFNLTNIAIPNSVMSIGSRAFISCGNLTNVTIPRGVSRIEDTFVDCNNLVSIHIPDTVTNIDGAAFVDCYNLSDIYYSGNESEWENIYIDNSLGLNDSFLNATVHYNIIGNEAPIKIILNGSEISFDQPPINKEGNLLVPIRMIAEDMGKTVLWSNETQTAFIDNGENALIIPIGEMHIYLGDDSPYDQWKTTRLLVPSEVIGDRTLVPIRQFCESLGAKVSWDQDSQTAYITYEKKTNEKMSETLFDAINLNYYIAHYPGNPFEYYTFYIDTFYEQRDRVKDAAIIGLSNPFDVISEIWSGLTSNSTNASLAIEETLYDVISNIDTESKVNDIDLSMLKDINSYGSAAGTILDETSGLRADFINKYEELKPLNDAIDKINNSNGTKYGSKILDLSIFSAEQIAYILSDYSSNVTYVNALESALNSAGCMDINTKKAIDDLKQKYTDKFAETLSDVSSKIVQDGSGVAMSVFTGGIYGLGKLAWETVAETTGLSAQGRSLKNFYAIYCYNGALDRAYDIYVRGVQNGYYDRPYVKALIKLEKATKKMAVEDIESASVKIEDLGPTHTTGTQLKQEIDSWTYCIWNYPYTIYHSPQRLD